MPPFLPDFAHESHFAHGSLYPLYQQPRRFGITPRTLRLARGASGRSELHLELRRALSPEPRFYGFLEMHLEAEYALEKAAEQLRAPGDLVTIHPLLPTSGFLRLELEELVLEMQLAWNALGRSPVRLALTGAQAALLRRALEEGTMPARSLVFWALPGIAARAPAAVSFNPADLLAALREGTEVQGGLSYPKLRERLTRDWENLPVRLHSRAEEGRLPLPEELRDALLDRLLARYGTLPAPSTIEPVPLVALAEEVAAGDFSWPLDDEITAWRPLLFQWHPLELLRAEIAEQGLTPFLALVEVPPLPTGVVSIEVTANLIPGLVNVLVVGAHLHAPPAPPFRPHALNASAELQPPAYRTEVRMRYGLRESPDYEIRPFLVLQAGGEILALDGKPRSGGAESVELTVVDFPVRFLLIVAEPSLCALAALNGEVRWQAEGRSLAVPVRLDRDRPLLAVALPEGAVDARLALVATSPESGESLSLAEIPVTEEIHLTLWHLPAFGPHRIRFLGAFSEGTGEIRLEVRPTSSTERTTLLLRPDRPEQEWGYVVQNPFRAAFVYRRLPDGEWSEPLSPLTNKEIHLP